MTVTLRPYQEEAIGAVAAGFRRGLRRMVISLPTGTGKTVVMARMIRGAHAKGTQVLLLAHRDELLEQARDKLCNVAPDLCDQIGFVRASQDEWDRPIVIASVQTLSRPARLARLTAAERRFGLIFTDETHHAAADSYQRIYEQLGALEQDTDVLMVGVSATPQRADAKDLGTTFQEVVYHRDLLWAMREGFLVELRGVRVKLANFDASTLKVRAGDYVAAQVDEELRNADAPKHTVQAWLANAKGRRTIVFTPTIALAEEMADEFRLHGVSAACISGVGMDERRDVLARFHTGDVEVVTNAMILTEGFDEPRVDCIVIARPTKSHILYKQMVGRGTRPYLDPDTGWEKRDCLILDMAGATDRLDLLSLPKLFGLGKEEDETEDEVEQKVAEQGVLSLLEYREEKRRAEGRVVARQVDLFRNRKSINWVMAQPGFWALDCGKAGALVARVNPRTTRWDVFHMEPDDPEAERKTYHLIRLGQDLDLGYAMGVAEDAARKANARALLDRNAKWRKVPASPGQLEKLGELGVEIKPGLLKGEASDILGAHFAQRRLRRLAQ